MSTKWILLLVVVAGTACTEIDAFSTGPGECYSGKIVEAQFVRQGFESSTRLSLTLNTDSLADGKGAAGLLWSTDGTFKASVISQMEQVAHDPISQIQFPGGRIRNYLVYVMVSDGAPAMVVISLMENEQVEVRVMRPSMICDSEERNNCEDGKLPALFGIFRMALDTQCQMPD